MKRIFLRSGLVCAFVLACGFEIAAQDAAKHPITFDDMIKTHRVAEPQISPDGKWVVYTVATPDMDANRNASNIWMVSTAGGAPSGSRKAGMIPRPSGRLMEKTSRFSLRAAAIPRSTCFPSKAAKRKSSPNSRLALTSWSPDGKTIAFTSSVYPEHALVESGELSQVGSRHLRGRTRQIQNAHARHLRRARLPRSIHSIA